MEGIIKTKIEHLEVKITECEMKNTLDGINDRVDSAEEKINKLEGTAIEIIQKETQREKK